MDTDLPTVPDVQRRLPLPQRLAMLAACLLAGLAACLALLAALGGPVSFAWAATAGVSRNYPGSAPCATTLQACLNGSSAGDTVVVLPGTYLTNGLTLNQAVSLTGVSSATVILHALANQRVLTVTGAAVDSSVVISGLTFAGGNALGATCPGGCGGAMLITGTAQPRLINLILRDSSAGAGGGGLYAGTGSLLALWGVAVLSNTSPSDGGGVYAVETTTISSGVFQNNTCSTSNCSGAGLFTLRSLVDADTQFLGNQSGGPGGAVFAIGSASLSGALFQNNQCTGAGCDGAGIFTNGTLDLNGTTFVDNSSVSDGGAAFAIKDVTLNGGLFQHNQCSDFICAGGGLFVIGNLTATNTQFQNNMTQNGGAGAFVIGAVILNGSVFQNNQCINGLECKGGALYLIGSLSGSSDRFVGNHSAGSGAGIYALKPITLSSSVFQNNQCTANDCHGGGLFAVKNLNLTNMQFLDNRAHDGAGVYQVSGSGQFVNDLFAANQANGHGDALYLGSAGTVSLLHTTVASPTLGSGAAIYVTSGTVGLTNTLLANYATGIENAGGTVREDYSLFSGLGTPFSGTVATGGHSHPGPAGFADPATGNYHLSPGSAAIDTGVNAGIYVDVDGDLRPMGYGFDIGFDEFMPELFLPLVRK